VVGLLVLSAVFWLLERWRPSLPGQRRQAADTRVDVAYWFFTPLVTRFVTRISVVVIALSHSTTPFPGSPRCFLFIGWVSMFHRWHHTTEEEGLDKNFAGLFPFIDLAFGTFYMPLGRQPQRFGVTNDDVPAGLVAQLAYPFRQK
jgi:sterol desaturase/sphingolipid hydroxylase (fatty acid hydroxylase superfamily)